MADYTLQQIEQLPNATQVRFRDMGDGTYAPVVAVGGTVTTGGSAAVAMAHDAKAVNGNTLIVAANADRKYLLLVNDSANTMYLAFGQNAQLNWGVRLNANGGSYEMGAQFGNLHAGAVYANCAVNNQVLLVTEGT